MFEQGGLVVDGGRGSAQTPALIVSRLPFPEQWRILVVLDPHRQGVQWADERELFGKFAPCSDMEAAHLCRLVLMKALPALANCDIAAFGSAIKELQARLGDYFAPIQGGSRFSSPDVAAVLDLLERGRARHRPELLGSDRLRLRALGGGGGPAAGTHARRPRFRDLDIRTCTGLNRGAEITAHAEADEPERQRWKTTRASGGTP